MILNVRDSKTTLRAVTNGGSHDHTRNSDLPAFFPVWLNTKSKLKIRALVNVRKKYHITSYTVISNTITVHLGKGQSMVFEVVGSGLYMWSPENSPNSNKYKVVAIFSSL